MKDLERFNAVCEQLVPTIGKADTTGGELLRAVCKISYRFYNDGDMIDIGYGKHSCNAPARYLLHLNMGILKELVNAMWGCNNESEYEKNLENLIDFATDIAPHMTRTNKESMLEYWEPADEDYDDED